MLLSPYPTVAERTRVGALWICCVLILVFLVVPIFVPVPLSFNSGSFFTFPLAGLSTRWYEVVLGTPRWRAAIGNSLLIGFGATILATVLGTLTAIGLSDPKFPARRFVVPLLISPLIVPVVVTAVGTYLFYARVGLANTYVGIILAHTVLASPFVVVTVGRQPHRLRSQSDAGHLDPWSEAVDRIPSRHAAADPARRSLWRSLRLRDVLRRSRRGAVSRQRQPANPAARNVHRPARTTEPGDHGGRHADDGPVDPVADRGESPGAPLAADRRRRAGIDRLQFVIDEELSKLALRCSAIGRVRDWPWPTTRQSTGRVGFSPISRPFSPKPRRRDLETRWPASRRRAPSSAWRPRWRSPTFL